MLSFTTAFILSKIKYKENSLICRAYCKEYGMMSFISKNAFSKKSNSKGIYFLPLAQVNFIFYKGKKNSSSLKLIKESSLISFYKSLHSENRKISMVFFLAEFLSKALKEEFSNENLFLFIENFLNRLDEKREDFDHFYLIFILKLSKFLGFFPNQENNQCDFFSLREGVFKKVFEKDCLQEKETLLFKKLLLCDFHSSDYNFNKEEREILSSILIHYYSFHVEDFGSIKSLEILKSLKQL
jgi:DNA repair protein RecO (recombination protein O)